MDLPDPLGPMIASFSPAATSRLKSSRIRVSPYDLLTAVHWMTGISGRSNFALQVTEKERGGVTNREENHGYHGIRLSIMVGHAGYLTGCT